MKVWFKNDKVPINVTCRELCICVCLICLYMSLYVFPERSHWWGDQFEK